MVVNELKALAKKMNVKMPSAARKAEIVELLSAAFRKKSSGPSITRNNNHAEKSALANSRKIAPAAKSEVPVSRKKVAVAKEVPENRTIVPKPTIEVPGLSREWKIPPSTDEPLMAQERVADAKYYTGPTAGQQAAGKAYEELPLGYGEEKIALLVRDPYLAYVYWEVTPVACAAGEGMVRMEQQAHGQDLRCDRRSVRRQECSRVL